jgi:hypothetical protein
MKENSSLGTEVRLPPVCQNKRLALRQTEPKPADKITLVFDVECATLFARIDEWKIHPLRVTEILLLRVSTLFSGTKKAAEDLPRLAWLHFAFFRRRFY